MYIFCNDDSTRFSHLTIKVNIIFHRHEINKYKKKLYNFLRDS